MINIRTLRIDPTGVKSFGGTCVFGCENLILAGRGYDPSCYSANLTFPPVMITEDEVIKSAALRLCCNRTFGSRQPLGICVNDAEYCQMVGGPGAYEWNVAGLVAGDRETRFCLYAGDQALCCGLRQFEAAAPNSRPVLEVVIDDAPPCPALRPINIVKKHESRPALNHSDWIECLTLQNYFYFIKNLGTRAVNICVEISPDQRLTVTDQGPITIAAGETNYLPPLRRSGFVRLSYRNQSGGGVNPILVWFQGIHACHAPPEPPCIECMGYPDRPIVGISPN